MVPTFCEIYSQSAWVTPSGLSIKMRRRRPAPPPSSSTLGNFDACAGADSFGDLFYFLRNRAPVRHISVRTNKKVGFRPLLRSDHLLPSIHGNRRIARIRQPIDPKLQWATRGHREGIPGGVFFSGAICCGTLGYVPSQSTDGGIGCWSGSGRWWGCPIRCTYSGTQDFKLTYHPPITFFRPGVTSRPGHPVGTPSVSEGRKLRIPP